MTSYDIKYKSQKGTAAQKKNFLSVIKSCEKNLFKTI